MIKVQQDIKIKYVYLYKNILSNWTTEKYA